MSSQRSIGARAGRAANRTVGAVSEDGSPRHQAYNYVRLWAALFVLGGIAELVTGLALNQRLPWPPSLSGPVIFASVWTGLAIAQKRYNSTRPR